MHDHRHSIFTGDAALAAVEDLVFADFRGGGFVFHLRRGVAHFQIGEGVRAALIAEQQRIALRVVARAGGGLQNLDAAAIGVLSVSGRDALADDGGSGVLPDVDHLGAGVGLLPVVGEGDGVELADGIVADQQATGIFPGDFGSDPAGMGTRAVRDGSDWVLDGTKMWITNGSIAELAVVWARTDAGVQGFLVPTATAGFSANKIPGKISLRASVTSELVLDGVRLPADAVLPGVQSLRGPLSCLDEARFGIAFGTLGAARDCLEIALDYSRSREVFNRPIGGYQLTQQKLADMTLELQKGFLLALHLGRLKDAGRLKPAQISLGKLNTAREAIAIARQCRTILGANGITLEYSVLRHANNLESVLTYEGTSEMHTLVIGQALTGLNAFS